MVLWLLSITNKSWFGRFALIWGYFQKLSWMIYSLTSWVLRLPKSHKIPLKIDKPWLECAIFENSISILFSKHVIFLAKIFCSFFFLFYSFTGMKEFLLYWEAFFSKYSNYLGIKMHYIYGAPHLCRQSSYRICT